MKKIAFITDPLSSGHAIRGVGFYTKRLLTSLKSQASSNNIEIIENGNNCDLIHYPFFDLFTPSLPLIKSTKTIVTIHDVIPLEFPEHYPLGLRGWVNLQLQKLSLLNVDMVITDSYASIKSIRKYLHVPHEKLRLIYLAADPIFKPIKDKSVLSKIKNKYHLPDKFILYVGDIGWNKNLPTLVKAAEKINYPLVIVGKSALDIEKLDVQHPELTHLDEILSKNMMRLGFVPDADLVALYNLATVYCQPSFAEGFGLPVLEALACDCPVACSNSHSLPEIGGEAVEYFDPSSIDGMVGALKKAKSADGPQQANKFSWEKTAAQTIMVYTETLAKE